MNTINWDKYFHTRYRPLNAQWGHADLELHKRWYTPWINFIVDRYHITFTHKNILELGCGIAAVSGLISERGGIVTATDVTEDLLEISSGLQKKITFEYLDILQKPKQKEAFDIIMGFEVLEHLDRPDIAIRNISIMLKKGGVFIGSTPPPFKKNMTDPTHVNVHYPEYWRQLFLKTFASVEVQPISVLPYLWKLHKKFNFILPWSTSLPSIVSTTLVVAKK